MDVDRGGFLSQNTTYDYGDYVYRDDLDFKDSETVFVLAVYSSVLAVGLLGHGLLLAALAQKRRSWSLSDAVVLNLGITDILLLLTLPLRIAQAAQHGQFFGNTLCKMTGAVFKLNFYCGIYLMVFISLTCCQLTTHTTQLCFHKKPVLVKFSCFMIWVVSFLLTLPDWTFLMAEEDATQDKWLCVYKYNQSDNVWPLLSCLLHHIFGFLLPAVTLINCSWVLLRRQHRSKRVILPLVVIFLLCWLPYNITLIVDTYRNIFKETPDDSLKTPLMVTTALGCIHACLRPLLYFSLCGNFRKWTLAMLRCDAGQSETSLWELGVSKKVLPYQNHEQEDLKKTEDVEQQRQ